MIAAKGGAGGSKKGAGGTIIGGEAESYLDSIDWFGSGSGVWCIWVYFVINFVLILLCLA